MPRKPKIKKQVPVSATVPDTGNMQMWKAIAGSLIGEPEGWHVMEVATALQESCQLIGRHWKQINKLVEESGDKAGQFSIQIQIDRAETPSEVSAKISYTKAYSDRITVKTPDPTQSELPLEAEEAVKEEE